jgi:hypothetical protein
LFWVSKFVSKLAVIDIDVPLPAAPPKKVATASDRLTTPTAAIEHYKKSRLEQPVPPKVTATRPVSTSSHLLTPTAAYNRGKANAKPEEEVKFTMPPARPAPRRTSPRPNNWQRADQPADDWSNISIAPKGRSDSISSTISSNSEASHDWSQVNLDNLIPHDASFVQEGITGMLLLQQSSVTSV